MKYRTDLILGEASNIFISFYYLDSGLSVLNGLQFYFWSRDSENPQLINYFLSFLFPTGFISDAIQFKHFLWLRFEDRDVYMMNFYWTEFAPLFQSGRVYAE